MLLRITDNGQLVDTKYVFNSEDAIDFLESHGFTADYDYATELLSLKLGQLSFEKGE